MSTLADRVVFESAREHARNHRQLARRCRAAYPSVQGAARAAMNGLADAHEKAAAPFEALLEQPDSRIRIGCSEVP